MVPPDSSRISRGREYSGTLLIVFDFRIRGYHPVSPTFPGRSASRPRTVMQVLQPHSRNLKWFGLFRVRSPLLAESRLISFPPGTEMFQFPGFASGHYVFMYRYPCGWVSPFGHARIKECSHLPEPFRRVPRPSSPLVAKAFTRCPYCT